MESSHDGDQKPVEDGAIEGSAVEAVAELAQVHLHVFGAGSVIGAVAGTWRTDSDHIL